MTGYGKGVYQSENKKFSVEIKSLNNKYSEFNVRLPRLFNPLEDRLRKLLANDIARGRVDVYVNFESSGENVSKIKYNKTIATSYHKALISLVTDCALYPDHNTLFNLVAKFPEVIEIDREVTDEQLEVIWINLEQATKAALGQFLVMREREGTALRKDLQERMSKITKLLSAAEAKAPEAVQNHRTRLKKRMEEVLSGVAVDETRFLNEVAHFSDKADITEEITRMKSHIDQMSDVLLENGAVGRKLDFVAQEMAREANTMGSKANFADISKIVIDLKSEIEKIREQVQNIE